MRDHEHGGAQAAVKGLQALEQQASALGIEGAGGLVGHDHGGVGDERASRGNALLLTTGHLVGILVEHLADGQARCHILHAGRNLCRVCAGDGERQGDVLACRERIEQVGILEDKAQLLAAELRELGLLHARHILAVDADGATRGGIDGRHAVEQRRLARARGSHDADEFAAVDGKVDVVERAGHVAQRSIYLFEMRDLQYRGRHLGGLHTESFLAISLRHL